MSEVEFVVSLRVGEYTITKWHDTTDTIYIGHDSGEGMGVKAEKFAELIDKFYKENF